MPLEKRCEFLDEALREQGINRRLYLELENLMQLMISI